MLRILPKMLSTSSARLFNHSIPLRTACSGGPSAEQEMESNRNAAFAEKKIHAQEILLCKLGSFAHSITPGVTKRLTPKQTKLMEELKEFHKAHRLDDQNALLTLINKRMKKLEEEIRNQEKYYRGSVRDTLAIKYEEFFKL